MKFNIMQKLLAVVALPIIVLLIFSANHIDDRFKVLQNNNLELLQIDVMRSSSNLVHDLQIERGVSAGYLNNPNDIYFSSIIANKKEKTDNNIKIFLSSLEKLDKKTISLTTQKHIKDLMPLLKNIYTIRDKIMEKKIKAKKSFQYYTSLNKQLISILNSFNLQSNSKTTNLYIAILNRIIQLQEFAGQERAHIVKLADLDNILQKDMRQLHSLITSQKDEAYNIHLLLENNNLNLELKNIQKKYKNNYFNFTRGEIINYELEKYLINEIYKTIGFGGIIYNLKGYNKTKDKKFFISFLENKLRLDTLMKKYMRLSTKKDVTHEIAKKLQNSFENIKENSSIEINPLNILSMYKKLETHRVEVDTKRWFKVSTDRINNLHSIENKIFLRIFKSIQENIETTTNSLRNQIVITLVTIILLLLSTYHIANRIKFSIYQLDIGMNQFFDFLNFKSDKPKEISTNSNDEINDMAQTINTQIKIVDENLENDKDFIDELTQIVRLMKDGDFSERAYFKPYNPNLLELKSVFDELIEFISVKIKEQTDSLESLNSSLEDRVHFQTLELEKQILEITTSRDKAIQAEIAKDEFLANMSHEIRTPLNAILGFVTILKRVTEEETSLHYLNIIDNSGKSLLTIINDILDFSKIQSGKFTISKHTFNPIDEFSTATILFASKAYEKNLIYYVYIDPNMPELISADATRIKQILSNLLSNAIKFTPKDREIKVSITIEGSKLSISVEDKGIGISKENQAKVFSAFEQADGSTTRKYAGTGLGLSISSKLSKLMDGELTLESQEGIGSIFKISIPIDILKKTKKELVDKKQIADIKFAILGNLNSCKCLVDLITKYLENFGAKNIMRIDNYTDDKNYDVLFFIPEDEYNEEIVNSSTPAIAMLRTSAIKLANIEHISALYAPFVPKAIIESMNNIKLKDLTKIPKKIETITTNDEVQFDANVLVVEDNKTNQMLITLILDDFGIECDIAKDGIEGVEMFKKGQYDLVLMDENMPNLNGIGAMKQIKEYEENNSLILTPIIALTASVLDTDKEMFINAGMDGFVGKPIDTQDLENELSKFLKSYRG